MTIDEFIEQTLHGGNFRTFAITRRLIAMYNAAKDDDLERFKKSIAALDKDFEE